MTTTYNIPADLLKDSRPIPFRYCVTKYTSDSVTTPYEFLHGAPSKGLSVNRCLIIPAAAFQIGGMHCIQDNILILVC